MDWLRTLSWILRGNGWGVVFMVALVAAVYAFVPIHGPGHGVSAQASHQDLGR